MERKSRTTYSLINMFANFAGYGINIILSFICRMVFVRCLSQEYLGVNGLFTNILSMLSLAELGIGTAIVYAMYKPIAEDDHEKLASLMKFYGTAYKAIGCTVALLGLALLPFLDLIVGEQPGIADNLHFLYLLYLFNSASSYFFSYRTTILTASQRNYVVVLINYIVVILQNIIQIIVLLAMKNFIAYLVIQILCGLATNIITSQKAKKDYPFIAQKKVKPLSREEKLGLVKNVKALTVYKLSGLLVNNTDNIVITYFDGLVTTGIASNYTLLSGMLASLLNMVFGSMTASVGNLNAKESDETKYRIFKALNLANFWLYAWGAVGIIVISGDLVRLMFGENYVLPQSIPIMLAINFYMVGMQTTVLNYKSTMGLFRYGQYLLLVTAAINIVGDIVLGSRFGLLGIFAATAVSRLFTNTWYEPYAVYKYGLHRNPVQYLWIYLQYLIVLILCTGLCYFLCAMPKVSLVPRIFIKILVCSVLPNLVFLCVFGRTEEGKYLKEKAVNILAVLKNLC
ncbi:MAG: lipopolysaccharide biosynthesis protein [Lachnospiraceae bacterium]